MARESRIGFPALSDFELGELRAVALDELRELHQKLRARGAGSPPPARVRGKPGAYRGIDVLLVAFGEMSHDLAVAGIVGRESLAAGGRTELAVDECPPGFRRQCLRARGFTARSVFTLS